MRALLMMSVVFMVNANRFADGLRGKVVKVVDGNTFEMITYDNESYKILLYGIDCPEIGQEFGDKAKKSLEKMILDKNVHVQIQGKDHWGTRLGIVLIEGRIDPRYELLDAGLAWTGERDPILELETIKEKARGKGRGLWRQPGPTPPWTYRRQQTLLQPKSR